MKWIYLEGCRGELTRVKNPRRVGNMARAEVVKTEHGYRAGEVIETFPRYLVHKAGYRQGFQWVKPVQLEAKQ